MENGVPRNRTLVAIAQAALKAHETGELEERVIALEAAVRRQERRVEERGGPTVSFLPNDGCPGPEVVDRGERLRLVDPGHFKNGGRTAVPVDD